MQLPVARATARMLQFNAKKGTGFVRSPTGERAGRRFSRSAARRGKKTVMPAKGDRLGGHPDPLETDPLAKDRQALDQLFSVTYEELRRLASSVRRGDPGATLSPTALVNEAWLKLAKNPAIGATSRLHFKRIAARAMRQLLVEAARRRKAGKRTSGGEITVTFDESVQKTPSSERDLIALNDALDVLARMNPRQAVMVETRFFGGLDIPETAALLNVSEATIIRDWRAAKAWLGHELRHAP
jgi:RNA polymerase sigma-70 factor, ECF subfamily